MNPVKVFENMAVYEAERKKLLDKITEAKIEGVLFVTGDRHHSCLQKLDRPNTYPLYDVTVSPFTSGPAKMMEEEKVSPTLIQGTTVEERNFALCEVTGTLKDRRLKISIFDSCISKHIVIT